MYLAPARLSQIKLVNSFGTTTAGPYQLELASSAATYGFLVASVEAQEDPEVLGPYKNAQWSSMAQWLGYRLYVTIHFTMVEAKPVSPNYGLSLLHGLWRSAVENQVAFGALQFALYGASAWHPMVPQDGAVWKPSPMDGKWQLFDVDFPLMSRELVTNPGEWADQQW